MTPLLNSYEILQYSLYRLTSIIFSFDVIVYGQFCFHVQIMANNQSFVRLTTNLVCFDALRPQLEQNSTLLGGVKRWKF